MLPFKRNPSEDSISLLRPEPTFKGQPFIDSTFKINLVKQLFVGFCCFALIAILWILITQPLEATIEVHLQTDKILRRTSDKFLSLGLDTSLIKENWYHYDSEKLLQLSKHLAPAHLRIGGTDSDRLLFSANSSGIPSTDGKDGVIPPYYDEARLIEALSAEPIENMIHGNNLKGYFFNFPEMKRNYDNFTMTGEDWTKIYNFSKNAGFNILFDLNVLLRDGDNWDSTNAEELIKFSNDHGFDVNWQLGNEPNSFRHVFNVTITGAQLGKDFNALRKILKKYPHYANNTLIVGPDVTRPKKFPVDSSTIYMTDFLMSVDSVDAVTWHHYYLNGRASSLVDFIDPDTFNILRKQIDAVKNVVNSLNVTSPIWLAETASAYGGGAPGLSNSFVAGFLWLDKLGIAAQMGLDVVVRQSLYHGYYALLDPEMNPLPDWWLSVIYKELVGPNVIKASESTGPVRLYCHCTSSSATIKYGGTITIFGMNMVDEPVSVVMRTDQTDFLSPATEAFAYVLTGKDGLLSKKVLLNGEELDLKPDGSLPRFKPKVVRSDEMVLAPESITFFVLHGMTVRACQE